MQHKLETARLKHFGHLTVHQNSLSMPHTHAHRHINTLTHIKQRHAGKQAARATSTWSMGSFPFSFFAILIITFHFAITIFIFFYNGAWQRIYAWHAKMMKMNCETERERQRDLSVAVLSMFMHVSVRRINLFQVTLFAIDLLSAR